MKKVLSSQFWFQWHSWIGVVFGMLLFVICWSGTFATLSHEFDWLVNPDMRVKLQGEVQPLPAIYQSARDSQPDARVLYLSRPLYSNFSADVIVQGKAEIPQHIYINPYTLEVLGTASFLNIQRYFRDFHRRLFLGDIGFYLVCAMSVPLLISLVSSLIFYRRWWRRFFEFKSAKTLRSTISNTHKLLGLWTCWFLLLIAITGGWYLFEKVRSQGLDGVFSYVDAFEGAVNPLPPLEAATDQAPLPFEQLFAKAQQVRPNLDITSVSPDRNGYFYVVGWEKGVLVRPRANKLFINPYTGDVVYSQLGTDLSPYWYWSNMADPLHFGTFLGLSSKLIWFVAGLILSFLCMSGVWLFTQRLIRNNKSHKKGRYLQASTVISVLLVAFTPVLPMFDLQRYQLNLESLSIAPGVIGFLIAWIMVTWALVSVWCIYTFRQGKYLGYGTMSSIR